MRPKSARTNGSSRLRVRYCLVALAQTVRNGQNSYAKGPSIRLVLEPSIAPYGTAFPSFLYSAALRSDNLARCPLPWQ